MAAGIVYHNITTATGVTFTLACWVPDTAAPDTGAVPVSRSVDENLALVNWLSPPAMTLPQEKTLPTTRWSYAAAANGIVNTTTAVLIKAADATLSNYLCTLQLSAEALGTPTEVVVRDGAGGTVLWRLKIGTAGLAPNFATFSPPLKSTAATLLEVATLTASGTGAVYVNAQGFVG